MKHRINKDLISTEFGRMFFTIILIAENSSQSFYPHGCVQVEAN